jgi:hypothetical protein
MWSIWRWVSPSTLLFAVLLAPLPWVEVQCHSRDQSGNISTSVTTMSGLQAAIGEFTRDGVRKGDRSQASVWMLLYLLTTLVGIIVGYRLVESKARAIVLTLSAWGAVAFLGLQIWFYFGMAALVEEPGLGPGPTAPGGPKQPGMEIHYTPWLLLVYGLHLLCLLTVVGDWLCLRRQATRANLEPAPVSSSS